MTWRRPSGSTPYVVIREGFNRFDKRIIELTRLPLLKQIDDLEGQGRERDVALR